MIATGTYVLLTHADQLDEIRRDPTLLPGAIEELLRYISMLFILVRTADAGHSRSPARRYAPATG